MAGQFLQSVAEADMNAIAYIYTVPNSSQMLTHPDLLHEEKSSRHGEKPSR